MTPESLALQCPGYGHRLRKYFAFDPEFVPLNHGALGATPRPVLDASNVLTLKFEFNPDDFLWLKYESKLNEVQRQIARLVNADTDECVLVPNVCNGINTILRNFEWREGDAIVIRFGSVDVTIALSIPAALQFRESLSGEEKINAYCRSLALAGGKRLAGNIGHTQVDQSPERVWTANMVAVELPLPSDVLPSFEIMRFIQVRLLALHKVYASAFYHNHRWWTRASAQVYNEISDFEKVGYALLDVCREIAQGYRRGPRL
ncbi:hypothetical protein EVJ58_g3016 [Rhodofomes roseus]|uniref:Uncharacterized protein n=1 Tax=Rhodofomes roseus TaxID=34475 RepID=A0A4Y9YPS1_9APHY|nr:hypothetical protein EVJ58_g3016 [Rhodofomes roseus]